MISENTLKRACSPAVLNRARHVADRGLRLHARRCRYDGGETVLRAKLDATYSWDGPYRTSVVLDEDADALVEYECDCPAARKFSGPCKHAIALVIDFNDRPNQYEGWDEGSHLATSRGVARLMERAASETPLVSTGAGTEQSGGTVGVEVTLAYEAGFDARIRLVGAQGAYVVKSLTELVSNVEGGAYYAYGKRLAFTHVREAFTEQGWATIALLVRAVQNRRAYAFERVRGRAAFVGSNLPSRELHLSPPELWELLELHVGGTILFEDRTAADGRPRALRVVREDPALRMSLASVGQDAYELVRQASVRVVTSGGRALAWDAERLYCCSQRLSGRADLLQGVYAEAGERLVVAKRDLKTFCGTVLPRLEEAVQVDVPRELEALRPAPCQLEFRLDRSDRVVTCQATAIYGEQRLPLVGGPRDAEVAGVMRDVRAEARGREVVRRYFVVDGAGGALVSRARGEALATLVFEGVPELQRVGTVLATPSFERLRSTARPRVRVGLSVRSNLLDLSFAVEGVPSRDLAGLLESYRLKKRYHRLRDGSFVDLAGANLAQASAVSEELGLSARQLAAGRVEMPAYRAFLLGGMVSEDDRDDSFDRYVDRVRNVDLSSYAVPASLDGVLRPYQVEGFRWLSGLADLGLGGILADEMGLGKSLQLIAFLLANRECMRTEGPSLVACPASLVYNWQAEFAKFAPELRVRVVAGTADEREQLRREGGADVLVTSYDLLRRDVVSYARMRLWCLTLDEAQYIKNHETLVAKAAKALDARHRVALTGTPVENRLSELWSIFDFLMPGLFGPYERFRERYERSIVEGEDEQAAARLRDAVRPFVLRRLKRDVLSDLPDKIEQVVYAHMGGTQQGLYDAQVQELRNQLSGQRDAEFGRGKLQVLASLMRLRQICCDPSLVFEGYDGGSCKVETILTLVARVCDAGEKMLVFSQFTSFLDIIAERLDQRGTQYFTITGSTPKRRRLELVGRFNEDDTPVFLISLKAGGTGLNLTGASVVVHADPWWNEAAQNQATDRAHRIGQTRDVTVYKVIVHGTIEDRIRELQRTKAELADAVVEGDVSGVSLATLTREDLEGLLG